MSNLNLMSGMTDRALRTRSINSVFPGALLVELFLGDDLVGYYSSVTEALMKSGTQGWERPKMLKSEGVILADSSDGVWHIQQGKNDWPPDEVAKRVVLIGELNPYRANPDFDLYDQPENSSGDRLRRLILGVSREDYFRRFYRRNLCYGKWSVPEARKRASELCEEFPTQTFVLLGRKVQEAFGIKDAAQLSASRGLLNDGGARWRVFLPHPSGLCRVWSDPGAFDRAKEVLKCAGVFCEGDAK